MITQIQGENFIETMITQIQGKNLIETMITKFQGHLQQAIERAHTATNAEDGDSLQLNKKFASKGNTHRYKLAVMN